MSEGLSQVWGPLSAAGGTLALSFIVAIALAIAALAVLYLASAILVLERFARVGGSVRGMLAFGVVATLGTTMATYEAAATRPGESLSTVSAFAPHALQCGLIVVFAMATWFAAIRHVPAEWLAMAALVVLGLGTAALAGSTGNPWIALAPAGLMLLVALALSLWRQRSSPPSSVASTTVGATEVRIRWLALVLALGIPLAVLAGGPRETLAALGYAVVKISGGWVLLGLLPLAAAGLASMRHSVEWFVAVRYLVAKRRQVFISAITAICIGGIAAGVWLIVVVLSVMNGFERTWREEILGNRAHLVVSSEEGPFSAYGGVLARVRETPGVLGAAPYLDADGLARSASGDIYSLRVRGIDPESITQVTDLADDVFHGSLDPLAAPAPSGARDGASEEGDPGIVIGNQLSLALGAGMGDPVLLVSPYAGTPTPLGPAPRLMQFRVVGIFQSSFFQYDEIYTYVSLASAQAFRGGRNAADVVDGIEVRTLDFYRSAAVGAEVAAALGPPFVTMDWKEFFPAFFQALKTERVMMFVLLTMVLVVAAFLIVATLMMMIMEKSNDIAILKAMGAEDAAIERIFAIEGTLIGLAGTVLGVVAGLAVTFQLGWIQDRIEALTGVDTLPSSVYQFSKLPSEIDPVQISVFAAVAMVLSLGATLLPSRQAAGLDPAEGLRYE